MQADGQTIRRKLYIAGPLFSEAELRFNVTLKQGLSEHFHVFLPQQDGELLVELLRKGVPPADATRTIFYRDTAAIAKSDVLLIVLDGRSVDEGAAFELGVAHALGKICVGIQTDPRRLLPDGNNPMIDGALHQVFSRSEELFSWAAASSATPGRERRIA